MCLNPLWIRNKGYMRLGGMPYVEVPCNKCRECQDTKQIDYFVRAWCMYRALPPGWSVFFCTLTFNEENVPRAHVAIRNEDCSYTLTDDVVKCFDHRILSRFLKSFRQYYRRDLGLPCPHVMVTSEYGERLHRPHYHAIMAVPQVIDDRSFKTMLERFWHYGFTKNTRIVTVDGVTHERSLERSFKYVTKYASKHAQWSPFYLNHGDDIVLHEVERCHYTPRVFMTNGFGSSVEAVLTDSNYRSNTITLDVEGTYKKFNLPAYYRRRFFTKSVPTGRIREVTRNDYWHRDEVRKYPEMSIEYKNGYAELRKINLEKRFRVEWFNSDRQLSESEYVTFMMRDYDKPAHAPYNKTMYDLEVEVIPHYLDVIKIDGIEYKKLPYTCRIQRKVVSLSYENEKCTTYVDRNPSFSRLLCSRRSIHRDIYDCVASVLRYKSLQMDCRRRRSFAKYQREREFYEQHEIR